jgi:hypothetical protein
MELLNDTPEAWINIRVDKWLSKALKKPDNA